MFRQSLLKINVLPIDVLLKIVFRAMHLALMLQYLLKLVKRNALFEALNRLYGGNPLLTKNRSVRTAIK